MFVTSMPLVQTPTVAEISSNTPTPTMRSMPSPSKPVQKPRVDLETGVKIGIGISAGLIGIVILIASFETLYLAKRRRKRAMQRAVAEVESGTAKESQERIVLESRVSIIVEQEDQDEEDERGRNGMSLSRREANGLRR